jgi:prepilin-type N-terminal cleavage/methylation domain-containing protein
MYRYHLFLDLRVQRPVMSFPRPFVRRSQRDESEVGFTMLELMTVIVILGILAATVMFSLGGLSGNAIKASCNSDAKSVEVAVQAFHDNPNNSAATNEYPTSPAQLTDPASDNFGGPYLHSWPSDSHYVISLDAGTAGQVDVNGHGYDGPSNPC